VVVADVIGQAVVEHADPDIGILCYTGARQCIGDGIAVIRPLGSRH